MRSRLVRKGLAFGISFVLVFVVFVIVPGNAAAAPPAPKIYGPEDDEWVSDNTPTLEWWLPLVWKQDMYEIELWGTDHDYQGNSGQILDHQNVIGEHTWSYLNEGNYAWKVRFRCDIWQTWSSWSTTAYFRVDTTPPENPNPISLSGGWTSYRDPHYITWTGASDALSGVNGYQYYWGRYSDGTSSDYTTSAYYDPDPIDYFYESGTFYFRVSTRDNAGNNAPWTTIYIYRLDRSIPSAPTISSSTHPTQTIWYSINDPTFSWNAVTGPSPVSYRYKFDYEDDFHSTNSLSKTYSDLNDGTHTFLLYARDTGGSSYTRSYTINIDTSPPMGTIIINNNDETTSSSLVTLNLGYSDSLSGVSQVRYSNDGVFDTEPWEEPTQTKSWTLTSGESTKTVWYQIKDNAGNTYVTSDSISYESNQPPVADTGGPYEGVEGELITLDSSGSYDPDDDTITYLWDLDNDGVYDDATPNPGHAWYDNGVYTVVLQVSDGEETDTDTATVTIIDVAPTLTLSGPASVDEGSIYTLGLSAIDPGDDTITSWEIDWGDGNVEMISGNPSSTTHTYADGPNAYTISASATNEDGTYPAGNTVEVTVNNVAPTLTLTGSLNADEGSVYTLELFSNDPGDDTITEWEIDWGDGTVETISGDPSSVTHIYTDGPNGYTISAKAFDEDSYGNTLITDAHDNRVIEVDSAGNIVWELTGLSHPNDAERLDNGNTLIVECDYSLHSGSVTDYTSEGNIAWQYTDLNIPCDAERLDNGNTLIADQHNNRVIEVDSDKQIVWKVDTNLKNTGITYLHYPVDVERLDNGNTLIVDMYNDRIIEVEPDFDVVWESPWSGYYTMYDAERLDNGNTLIPFAVFGTMDELDFNFNLGINAK